MERGARFRSLQGSPKLCSRPTERMACPQLERLFRVHLVTSYLCMFVSRLMALANLVHGMLLQQSEVPIGLTAGMWVPWAERAQAPRGPKP
jgi:hypothetical protein